MRVIGRIGLLLAVLLLAPMHPGSTPVQESVEPLDRGLQEKAGVTLLMLDVKVRDEDGRPVRGLTLDDFEVTINGRLWPLEAGDDFCNCDGSSDVDPRERARGESTDVTAGLAADSPTRPLRSLPQHYVIYLDFSEMQHTGRGEAER